MICKDKSAKQTIKKINWNAIKLIMFDCDGVLTDGKIIYTNDSVEIKNFSARDGMGFTILHKAGLPSAVVTARNSQALSQRCKELKINHLCQGIQIKLKESEKLLKQLKLKWNNVVYMGDDWNDIPVMKKAAFSVCPNDAAEEIKTMADMVTVKKAGEGAARECIDFVLCQKGIFEQTIQAYLKDIS